MAEKCFIVYIIHLSVDGHGTWVASISWLLLQNSFIVFKPTTSKVRNQRATASSSECPLEGQPLLFSIHQEGEKDPSPVRDEDRATNQDNNWAALVRNKDQVMTETTKELSSSFFIGKCARSSRELHTGSNFSSHEPEHWRLVRAVEEPCLLNHQHSLPWQSPWQSYAFSLINYLKVGKGRNIQTSVSRRYQ